jgi:hypothetical protein
VGATARIRSVGSAATVRLAPEYTVLLDAVRGIPSGSGDRRPLDGGQWRLAVEAAAWHRLEPLVYAHVAEHGGAPAEVLAGLEESYVANAARNLHIRASVERICDALAAAGIPAMTLKGAALIEAVYPDPAVREMRDIDVLVPAETLDGANTAVGRLGFHPAPALDPRSTSAWMRANHLHDPALVADDGVTAVELHHHIGIGAERAYFDVSDIWDRARPGRGRAHLLPSAEDLLIHACFHFTRNRSGSQHGALGQICDIARIVERERIDWDAVASIVRGYRLQTRVFLALFAARELGIPIPEAATGGLRHPGFDPRVGRRLVELRVLRTGRQFPVRRLGWLVAPPRSTLVNGWDARPEAGALELARAYVRRARGQLPQVRAAVRTPGSLVADYLLDGQIRALEAAERVGPAGS